jgi:hypothetical protein
MGFDQLGIALPVGIIEGDNIRAGLEWAISRQEKLLGVRLASAYAVLWVIHAPEEGARWFERLLALPGELPDQLSAAAHLSYGTAADFAGQYERADALYATSLAEFTAIGDQLGRSELLQRNGIAAMRRGHLDRARAMLDQGLEIARNCGSRSGELQVIGPLGALESDLGNIDRARALLVETLDLSRGLGVLWWEVHFTHELAYLELGAGNIDEAEALGRRALGVSTACSATAQPPRTRRHSRSRGPWSSHSRDDDPRTASSRPSGSVQPFLRRLSHDSRRKRRTTGPASVERAAPGLPGPAAAGRDPRRARDR